MLQIRHDNTWNTPVKIKAVICPVLVTFYAADKNFSIDEESVELARKSVAGLEAIASDEE